MSNSIFRMLICFSLFISCNSPTVQNPNAMLPCHPSLHQFEQVNFEHWQPLNNCSLDDLKSYFPDWEAAGERTYYSGKNYTPNTIKTFLRSEQEPPKAVYYQQETKLFTKIAIEYPATENLTSIIKSLGEPDLKLDFYLDVLLFEKGEWVYLEKGLAFRFGTNEETLWEMFLFNPCTEQYYLDEIYFSEQAREHPDHGF